MIPQYTQNKSKGYIVESGSNENGDYIKFSDGTMICYGKAACIGEIQTALGASYRTENKQTGYFPAPFINTNIKIILTARAPLNIAYLDSYDTSSFTYWALTFIKRTEDTRYVHYMAVGKWK